MKSSFNSSPAGTVWKRPFTACPGSNRNAVSACREYDILLGEPQLSSQPVGFGVVDPDYINIMVTGHQHALIGPVQEGLGEPWAVELARDAGAKGFKIVGCTCVGQDIQSRGGEVFAGHAGNNFTSEALLATGGIDLVISEFNCTLPGIEEVCRQYMVAQICGPGRRRLRPRPGTAPAPGPAALHYRQQAGHPGAYGRDGKAHRRQGDCGRGNRESGGAAGTGYPAKKDVPGDLDAGSVIFDEMGASDIPSTSPYLIHPL